MTSVNCNPNSAANQGRNHVTTAEGKTPTLHQLATVRRREEISRRSISRRLGINLADVTLQECESTDIPLSVLYQWQKALEVPLMELLQEPDESLPRDLATRARLLRLMKSALSISEQTNQTSVKRLVQTLLDQLIELMPELREVKSWPAVGRKRRSDEYGRAAQRRLVDESLYEHE